MTDLDQLRAAEGEALRRALGAAEAVGGGCLYGEAGHKRGCLCYVEENAAFPAYRKAIERRVRAEDEFTAGYPAGGLDPTPPPAGAAS